MFEWRHVSKLKLTPTEWLLVAVGGALLFKLFEPHFKSYATTDARTFSVVGDIDYGDDGRTAQNLVSESPNRIVLLGDYGYDVDANTWWNSTMKAVRDSGIPVIATLGNHDQSSAYLKIFGQSTWNFTRTVGNTRFVSINTQSPSLSSAESKIKSAQNNPDIRWIIPIMHKCIVTPQGSHHPPEVSINFHKMFQKYSKIKLVLQAHNHNYFRSVKNGITYIVVGSGGRKFYVDASDLWTKVHIPNTSGVLKCSTNANSISSRFVDNGGATLDSFTVS
mgnify:CR=1 FL=1